MGTDSERQLPPDCGWNIYHWFSYETFEGGEDCKGADYCQWVARFRERIPANVLKVMWMMKEREYLQLTVSRSIGWAISSLWGLALQNLTYDLLALSLYNPLINKKNWRRFRVLRDRCSFPWDKLHHVIPSFDPLSIRPCSRITVWYRCIQRNHTSVQETFRTFRRLVIPV